MKRSVILSILLTLTTWSALSKEQYIFTQISQKDGLAATINDIFTEDKGNVWISTPSGLFSFNGSVLENVSNEFLDGKRIMHTSIDEGGNHWILTNKGLVRYFHETDTFELTELPDGENLVPFHSLCHDKNGTCFGSVGKIYRYDLRDGKIRLLCEIKENPSFICRNMNLLDENTVMCSSLGGMILVDTRTGEIKEAPYGHKKEVAYSMVDSKGRIWLALYNQGIKVFEKGGRQIHEFNTDNSELSSNIVLCLTEKNSSVWAGTDGGGINVIDTENNTIKVLSHVPGNSSSFPTHSIKSIYTDSHGNIWAGSIRDGLIRISRSGMMTYTDSHIGTKSGLSNPTVLSLYQDPSSDLIWIGTDGEGLNSFNSDSYEFTHYESTLRSKVVSIASYSDSELAISVYSDGIWIFDRKTGKKRPMFIDNELLNYQLKYAGRGINVQNENDGSLLIIGNTVSRYDRQTGRCQEITRADGKKASGNYLVIGLSEDRLWLHDESRIFSLRTGDSNLEEVKFVEGNTLRCGSLGKDGEIWFATDLGLDVFDPESKEMTHIRTSLFDAANSVVCDGSSRIWVGTDNHLFAYQTDSRSFAMFGESDGAYLNEYLPKPHLLAGNGDVYMGGVLGLLRIDSEFVTDNQEEPVIRLDRLKVDGKDVRTGKDGYHRLSRKDRTLYISVAAYERDMFREKMFRFGISGTDDVIETSSSTLELQQMPVPGVYDITVSCSKRNGRWTDPVRIMTLDVPKPFHTTWWFIMSCMLATAGIFLSSVLSALRIKENRMQMALKEQEQKVYEEKVGMLINISHELRTPLTLIMAPLKRLINETDPADESFPILNRIYRQSRRMKDLLNMVLDLRKMEVGKSSLKIESVRINDWLTAAVEDMKNEGKEVGISIRMETDSRLEMVELDRQKCDTVVTNILMNAIKHSTAGDTITIRTELTDEGMARVRISDQGPGLVDIDESRMFTMFYQSDQEQYGSGIGLSYSKILVELHGGHIHAENNPDRGASFWWEIPVISPEEKDGKIPSKAYLNEILGLDTATEEPETDPVSVSTSEMSLMLVDDNQDLLYFLKEALCSDFADIILMTSGNKAYSAICAGTVPDMIISDIHMPDGDGFKLCKDIKSNDKFSHIPVVLLTARSEGQSQGSSYRLGADGFIEKPFEIDTLMDLIRSIFRRKAEIRKKYLDSGNAAGKYGSNDEGFIIRFNKVVEENLGNPDFDQQILCRELGMSRAALYNKIKTVTGTGSKEYITRIRIERAKALIEKGGLSLTEISEMTGFSAPGYFSTAFKNYTGMTPSQYRQGLRKQ